MKALAVRVLLFNSRLLLSKSFATRGCLLCSTRCQLAGACFQLVFNSRVRGCNPVRESRWYVIDVSFSPIGHCLLKHMSRFANWAQRLFHVVAMVEILEMPLHTRFQITHGVAMVELLEMPLYTRCQNTQYFITSPEGPQTLELPAHHQNQDFGLVAKCYFIC